MREQQHAAARDVQGVFEAPGSERAVSRAQSVAKRGGAQQVQTLGVVPRVRSNDAVAPHGEREPAAAGGGGVDAPLDAVLRRPHRGVDALHHTRRETLGVRTQK